MRELGWAVAIFSTSVAAAALYAAFEARGHLLMCQSFVEALKQ